jgi:hypothetical protein
MLAHTIMIFYTAAAIKNYSPNRYGIVSSVSGSIAHIVNANIIKRKQFHVFVHMSGFYAICEFIKHIA